VSDEVARRIVARQTLSDPEAVGILTGGLKRDDGFEDVVLEIEKTPSGAAHHIHTIGRYLPIVKLCFHSPNDPGIPEARAEATAQLEAVAERFAFSDEAIVLGEGRRDSCAFGTTGWFGTSASNYRCWMQWVELVVIPAAATREEVAAALDAELAVMDAPIAGGVVRSLVLTHPDNVSIMAIGASGHEGDVLVSVQSEGRTGHYGPNRAGP
jgi:hypothetical protein